MMYYYYVVKNWIISKYYSIFGGCITNNSIEYNEPLLNSNYEDEIKEEDIVKKDMYDDKYNENLDDNELSRFMFY